MIIIPAIDLIDGKCVRLKEGDFNRKDEYNSNPLNVAEDFKKSGAKRIHIVDLDGAREGHGKNRKIIAEIKKQTGLIVETGGGIRTEDDIKELIDYNVDYLILGTVLIESPEKVSLWAGKYKERLVAGIDARDGIVKTKGWLKDEGVDAVALGKEIKNMGFVQCVYTDISRDGMMKGSNIEATKHFAENTGLNVILSGGVSGEADIKNAYNASESGIIGAIIGKAYYEGKIDLEEIIKKYQD